MPEVLLVDDDPGVRELLSLYFSKSDFTVRTAADGEQALAEVRRQAPDLIILDIMMPGLDGFEVCRRVQAETDIPIIFLTARDDDLEPIIGLELGADDYVTKPFNAREVVARARAVLRRGRGRNATGAREALDYPQFHIDPATREVTVNGGQVDLTPHEFDIIYLLATRPRIVFPRPEIMKTIWGYDSDYGDYRTVDTHLKRARQKLRDAGLTACRIETVWGIGYRFLVEDEQGE
jgi:two-component system response regulator ResD